MAYAAVISLKHNIEHLADPAINPKITTDAYNTLSNLGVILQKLDTKKDQRFDVGAVKALDAEIRKAVWKIEDVLESLAFRHSLPPSDDNGVEREIQSLIKTVKRLGKKFNRQLDNRFDGEEEDDDDDDEGVSPKSDFGGSKQSTAIGFLKDVSKSIIKSVKELGSKFNAKLDNQLDGEEEDDDDDYDDEAVPPIPDNGRTHSTTAVVSDNDARDILKWLFDDDSSCSVYSITCVGMAGIGKTHYAREIYQHPLIVQSFDFRAWARVGRKCRSVKKVLLQIVAQIERKPRNVYVDKDEKTLSKLLKKSLDGGTCLVVLDDIWSIVLRKDAMDSLREAGVKYFLLTSRIHDVYTYMGNFIFEIPFMNNEDSWNLLWRNVFGDKSSFPPPQLERAGKKIAKNCEGLPLLILAVADILSGEDKTEEYWNKVANKKTTTFKDAYEKILHVLCSSYDYLPEHLKACFLYMGVFPQSSEFSLRKLIILLTVENFLEPNEESLKSFIVKCLEKLVENSVLMRKNRYNYDMKSCKLHSAYWYLCVKEARSIKFFHVLDKLTDASEDYVEGQRRLSVQNNILFGIKEVCDSMAAASTTRSLLFTGEYHEYPVPMCSNSRCLRVLDAAAIRFYEFPEEVVKLLLLRYLSLTHNGKLPSSISNLQKLQYLIARPHHNINLLRDSHSSFLPREIWEVQQLKFLWIMGRNLPDPSNGSHLANLETLYVNAHSCTKAVFRGLPNLKKLVVRIELQPDIKAGSLDCLEHITCLGGLESLRCVVANPRLRSQIVAPPHHLSNLPRSLVKLSLNGLGYSWKYMRVIGSLPNLQELKLRCCTFQGTYWETMGAQFQRLDFLLLEDIDLEYWLISKSCFPEMKHLTIRHCFKLKEIILEVEALRFLPKMEVFDCSPSFVASALQMGEKLYCLEVVINSSWSH